MEYQGACHWVTIQGVTLRSTLHTDETVSYCSNQKLGVDEGSQALHDDLASGSAR